MQIVWTVITVAVALVYARSMIIWGLLSFMFGWPAFLVMFALGPKIKKWEYRMAAIKEFKRNYYGVDEVEYKDFNNVDDLMKQL